MMRHRDPGPDGGIWGKIARVTAISTTYTGAIIGAGFASGQEVVTFFLCFGARGIGGIIVSGLLLGMGVTLALNRASRLPGKGYSALLRAVCGPGVGSALELTLTLFLPLVLGITIAGGTEIIREMGWLPQDLAGLAMTVLVVLGAGGSITSLALVNLAPVAAIILITLAIAAATWDLPIALIELGVARVPAPLLPGWASSAILYVSYNLLLSLAVIPDLSALGKSTGEYKSAGLLSGLILVCLNLMAAAAILSAGGRATEAEIPMSVVSKKLGDWVVVAHHVAMWSAMYTTAAASAFGLAGRVSEMTRIRRPAATLMAGLFGYGLSHMGFAPLLRIAYPLYGYFGLAFLACLLIHRTIPRTTIPPHR